MSGKRQVTRAEVPSGGLLAGALPRVDASDCFVADRLPGDSGDAWEWGQAVFGAVPGWVRVLLRVRNGLVRPFGLKAGQVETEQIAPFPVLQRTPTELLMGLDDRHLDFRFSVRVTDTRALLSTVVQVKSRFGRFYWSVVRHFHPVVVSSMLRRTPVTGTRNGRSITFDA